MLGVGPASGRGGGVGRLEIESFLMKKSVSRERPYGNPSEMRGSTFSLRITLR